MTRTYFFSSSREKQNTEATNLEVSIYHEINLANRSADEQETKPTPSHVFMQVCHLLEMGHFLVSNLSDGFLLF